MAAYAALVSLMHIIEQIQHHPRPPIYLDKEQVESLTEKVAFLQDFLEGYSSGGNKDSDGLERRIADATYVAEDIIESHIVDQIRAGSTSTRGKQISGSIEFYQHLQKVIQDMDLIKREVTGIKEKMRIQDHLHRKSMSAGSSKSPSTGQNTMVGFDDVLDEIMDKLTGQQSDLQIIPIVGMGGIGKTTLARNIYVHPLIVERFDICAWATVSQDYSIPEICVEVLCQGNKERKKNLSQLNEYDLGDKLHKSLSGRRYLIIFDDIWSIEVWERMKFFFPDNNNGSRIMVTTRLSTVAFQLTGSNGFEINFLDDDKSWDLLCKHVFGEDDCPLELEEIGKKIAKNCKGLPLSIEVIGGFLAKSQRTREYWEYIAENLSSTVNLEDNERCLKILQLSYYQLPVHLKSYFLYMGIFPEDGVIRISWLVRLLVAEGFLKPIIGKSLEVVAEEYLKDLIDRNLILVRKFGSNGKIKWCIIHDLLRDLCIREAQKEKFLFVTRQYSVNIPQSQRRIGIHRDRSKQKYLPQILHSFQIPSTALSQSLVRSVTSSDRRFLPSLNHRLLRVLKASDKHSSFKPKPSYFEEYTEPRVRTIFQLVNLRFLAMEVDCIENYKFPSSIHLLWNLQTLIVNHPWVVIAPSEIWKMPQLKHVKFYEVELPNPQREGRDDFVLANLETLMTIRNFKCGEEILKRIPNIKKLRLCYGDNEEGSSYCPNNLDLLQKLESFGCTFYLWNEPSRSDLLQNLNFPSSLMKLSLGGSRLHWEDMNTKLGSLPHLQVLKLHADSFIGPEWETVEGQFCSLKFLLVEMCDDLEYWTTDSAHFPCLEQLRLGFLGKLKEIPFEIGEIPTLQSIQLEFCSDPAIISARKILDEQEELGNADLQVRVRLQENNQVLESLASRRFQVEILLEMNNQ